MRAVILLCLLMGSAAAGADDFRGFAWGVAQPEVKKGEKAKLVFQAPDGSLMYKDSVAGVEMTIIYQFSDGRLASGSYHNKEQHTNKNDYISDFNKFKDLLTKKYGEPKKDQRVWRNDLYKDEPSEWGMAVAVGHLVYRTEWESERTKIVNSLRGDKYKINNIIVYRDKASEAKVEQEQEKETLDKL